MRESVFNPEQQNTDLASKIVVGLERLSEAFRVLLWEHAKVVGLSPIQIQILIFVAFHDEGLCNVSQLAREFNLSKPTISDAVKVLDKKGLIHKISSSTDKRGYSIQISGQGQTIVEQVQGFAEPLKNGVSQLSPSDQASLYQQIHRLISDLNQMGILSIQRSCKNCRFFKQQDGKHYCSFLEQELTQEDIRLDCPEFVSQNTT